MKNHLEKMSSRLPYHFDDDEMSNHSATSPQINAKDTTMDRMVVSFELILGEVAE